MFFSSPISSPSFPPPSLLPCLAQMVSSFLIGSWESQRFYKRWVVRRAGGRGTRVRPKIYIGKIAGKRKANQQNKKGTSSAEICGTNPILAVNHQTAILGWDEIRSGKMKLRACVGEKNWPSPPPPLSPNSAREIAVSRQKN